MRNIAYLSLFILFTFGCKNQESKTVKTNEVSVIHYAEHFSLEQKKDYIELIVKNPENGEVEQSYALVKRGTSVNTPNGLTKLEIPLQNVAAFSTGFIGMISEIEEIKSIKATTSGNYIYNKELNKQISKKQVLTADFEGAVSPADLLSKKINLVMYSGFGSPYPNQDKLEKLDVHCMAIYDWKELHPLGKAEWIKLFGALYDKNDEANAYFEQVEKNYKAIKAITKRVKKQKKAITGGMFGDVWNATAGESFLAGIMKDAGLNYIYKNTKGTGSNQYSLAKIIVDESECDVWINAEATSINDLLKTNPKFATLRTVQSKNVYTYYGNTNYFWEYNSMHPDWILEDFAMISGAIPMKKMHFYSKLK